MGPGAVVEAGARVGARVRVHPLAVVGAGARVGDDSVLFPGVVLYPNILCEGVDLEAPTCTCLGNGGSMSIAITTDVALKSIAAEVRLRTATLAFDRIPAFLTAGTTPATTTGAG